MTQRTPPIIEPGGRYEFHSTLMGDEPTGIYPRHYSGQTVTVLHEITDVDPEVERLFKVRADDGVEFAAFQGELDGWYFETNQWVRPDGSWIDA